MLPKVGSTIGGKYALEAVIGRGGMGAVYRAKNVRTGRRVALKWILPTLNGADEMRARLLREARAMGRIEHPNVCAVYDVGEDGEAIYLVMELLSGRTLRAMMDEGRLEVGEVVPILLSALQGVSAAHLAGVVHRDLKPDNLFVCEPDDGGRSLTKVLDFGVSKILDLRESDGLTKSGMSIGTPQYMSPEQIVGSKDVDARSDLYALGTILYAALAGRLPYDGENYSALVIQIAMGAPPPLEELVEGEAGQLGPIVRKAMAREPADRHADAAELARALEPFAGGLRFESPRPRPRSEPPPPAASAAPSDPSAPSRLETREDAVPPSDDDIAVAVAPPEPSSVPLPLPPAVSGRTWLLVAGLVALVAFALLGRMTMGAETTTSPPSPVVRGAPAPELAPEPAREIAGPRTAPAETAIEARAAAPAIEAAGSDVVAGTAPAPTLVQPAPETARHGAPVEAAAPRRARTTATSEPEASTEPHSRAPEQRAVTTATGRSGTLSTADFE